MLPNDLEQTLRDLSRRGTCVKDRGYRQVWRFEHGGRAYFLKFYRKRGWRDYFRRLLRGSPAMLEFRRLQLLQTARVPSPRAVATLMGFRIGDDAGDAVIMEAIEPAVTVGEFLQRHMMNGTPVPDRPRLSRAVGQLVEQLDRAGLGHNDLHLGNLLLAGEKLYLLDGYAVKTGGLRRDHLLMLGHSAAPFATATDLLRGWRLLGDGGPMPRRNRVSDRLWRGMDKRIFGDNRYFGQLRSDGGWRGVFAKRATPRPWSVASALEFTQTDWERAWPTLLQHLAADDFTVKKRSRSGDVLFGELIVGGRPMRVVVKHPRHRYWYRYLNEIGRGSRPRRAWRKAWMAIHRDLPTAQPLLMMERRRFGYVVESVIVYEHVAGDALADVDLDAMAPADRDNYFRRAGRVLRRIESLGWSHFDAKSNNWMVHPTAAHGPVPVMVDIDGIRHHRRVAHGVLRLLRGMRNHPQYTPADSLALCQGYAPRSVMREEQAAPAPDAAPAS